MSDCHYLKYNNDYLIYCNIKSNELEYFNYYEEGISEIPMVYTKFCGYKESTNLNVYRLDEDFSPIFYINKLYGNITKPRRIFRNKYCFKGIFQRKYYW